MTPRAKNRLALLVVLAVVAGALVVAFQTAPPRDDVPAVTWLFERLEKDEWPVALFGTALSERWRLPDLAQHTQMRRTRVGAFVRVVSAGPAEPVPHAKEPTETRTMVVAFERREMPVEVTLVKRGQRWVVLDFRLRMPGPVKTGQELESMARRAARLAAEQLGRLEAEPLHDMVPREQGVAEPIDRFRERLLAEVGQLGHPVQVEERDWRWDGSRGTLRTKLSGPEAFCLAEVTVGFDSEVSRWTLFSFHITR